VASARVLLLEDTPERVDAVREALAAQGAVVEVEVVATVPELRARLAAGPPPDLLSLDHDLGAPSVGDDGCRDPGTGVDAVMLVRELDPPHPVLVHTSDPHAAERMQALLKDAGRATDWLPLGRTAEACEPWVEAVVERLGGG